MGAIAVTVVQPEIGHKGALYKHIIVFVDKTFWLGYIPP